MELSEQAQAAFLEDYRKQAIEVFLKVKREDVVNLIRLLESARAEDRQIFVCGNGGSAATASHFATDLGKGASFGKDKRFRVLSLTDNIPWISALANDTDYSMIFVEQLKNYARPGDLLIAFSGSGNSPNVVCATEWARQNGVVTIGITGRPGGSLGRLAEHPVHVESSHMGRIEDAHFFLQHILCYYFMEKGNPR
jgi:D-sedoheptulose 7-phosphate isomerase